MQLKKESGVSIIMALLLMMIISTVITQVSLKTKLTTKRTIAINEINYAHHLNNGALNYAKKILQNDSRSSFSDHENEIWAYRLPAYEVDIAKVEGYINEVSSKFNIHSLIEENPYLEAVFYRLVNVIGINQDKAKYAITLLRTKNYYSLIGLLSAANFSNIEINEVSRYITFLPVTYQKININLVSDEVYAAYMDLDLESSHTVLESIKDSPIMTNTDLLSFISNQNIYTIDEIQNSQTVLESNFGITSRFFQVISVVTINEKNYSMVTLIERIDENITTLQTRLHKLAYE